MEEVFSLYTFQGGPTLHEFLDSNLNGPSLSTKKEDIICHTFVLGVHGNVFNAIAKIYQEVHYFLKYSM